MVTAIFSRFETSGFNITAIGFHCHINLPMIHFAMWNELLYMINCTRDGMVVTIESLL